MTKEDFEAMIKDWLADHPEMEDLRIEKVTHENGQWSVDARDDKCLYSLTDDGDGNITINYEGSI